MFVPKQSNDSKIPFTPTAYKQLQDDLHRLLQQQKEIMHRLQIAREMGDLSENGAYQYAKFELGATRRELRRVRHLLQNGQVTQISTGATAQFGSTITLSDGATEKTFMLVSQHESDPQQNKLSIESPLGQAIIGRKAGEKVEVITPRGTQNYTILSVS